MEHELQPNQGQVPEGPIDLHNGLSRAQVRERVRAGAVNTQKNSLTPSYSRIIIKNTFTLFNMLNLFLALAVILVGSPKSALFLGTAICNTFMGILQEIRAKRTLDKLSILAESHATVIREGERKPIPQDELVLDDIVYCNAGDQISADAIVVQANGLEVDESLLTGESDRIRKQPGDTLLSGSYVTGGQAYTRVTGVGETSYATTIATEAKKEKKNNSQLLRTLNHIIRVLTLILVPLGGLLFVSTYFWSDGVLQESVVAAVTAMTGMIPEGLVLLTGLTLTISAMNLARKKALVQSLYSIETLARVDTLCLDKTGTITDGTLSFDRLLLQNGADEALVRQALSELMGSLQDTNSTATIVRATFDESHNWQPTVTSPFSSDRKWSGVSFSGVGTYVMGAPNMILSAADTAAIEEANKYAEQGLRVVCLTYCEQPMPAPGELPNGLRCAALLLLSDTVREDAAETFQFFRDEGVEIKVISGDNPRTVSAVAKKAGLEHAEKAIDMRLLAADCDYANIVEDYTVFGHVNPEQKRELIRAMQANGRTTCMTGDGVNDILAMRQSDCSVGMVNGSDAARGACDFVLMDSNFKSMIHVLQEGRRVINNIERVASLYLVKTFYSVLLSTIYIFLDAAYPFVTQQLTPINALTVGLPSFLLAFQGNYKRPEAGQLSKNIIEHSLPSALTIVFNTLYLQLASSLFDLSGNETSTMVIFLIGIVGFYHLHRICKPHTTQTKVMIIVLPILFLLIFIFLGWFFDLGSLMSRSAFFYLPLVYFSYYVHGFLGKYSGKALEWVKAHRKKHAQPKVKQAH